MEPEISLPHAQVPATVPVLSQINPVHSPTSHFLKIRFNICLVLWMKNLKVIYYAFSVVIIFTDIDINYCCCSIMQSILFR